MDGNSLDEDNVALIRSNPLTRKMLVEFANRDDLTEVQLVEEIEGQIAEFWRNSSDV